jgi:hypothetical protein
VHRPAYTATFVALPGVDAIRSFRALLKVALRRFGLRAIDVRECALYQDERARAQPGRPTMSAFSERIRSQKKGFFKVKTVDILNFQETGQQLQLNQTTSEWLLDHLGTEPEAWAGKKVTLFLDEYTYDKEKKLGVRLRLPGEPALGGDGPTRARPAADRKTDIDDEIPF